MLGRHPRRFQPMLAVASMAVALIGVASIQYVTFRDQIHVYGGSFDEAHLPSILLLGWEWFAGLFLTLLPLGAGLAMFVPAMVAGLSFSLFIYFSWQRRRRATGIWLAVHYLPLLAMVRWSARLEPLVWNGATAIGWTALVFYLALIGAMLYRTFSVPATAKSGAHK